MVCMISIKKLNDKDVVIRNLCFSKDSNSDKNIAIIL